MKFREFETTSGTKILAGKSAENNEELMRQVEESEYVFHTKMKGSPFVNIKGKPIKKDITLARIICAVYSQDWKKNKMDVVVHEFKGKDVYKDKRMKAGTFRVRKYKESKVSKNKIKAFEEEWLKK